MLGVIKTKKGLDINLKGIAKKEIKPFKHNGKFAVIPDNFHGITPKADVKEYDEVQIGDILFHSKINPEIKFTSPVSGKVTSIVRGERRKILRFEILANENQTYKEFYVKDLNDINAEDIKQTLMQSGLFGYIRQLPYAVCAFPNNTPKNIFVSAFRDMPLASNFEFELKNNEKDFQTGLDILSKIAKTHLGISKNQTSEALKNAKNVDINIFNGPCPIGNASLQAGLISPVNKGEIVWMVDPFIVICIGRLFNNGKLDMRRKIAIAGSEVKEPCYTEVIVGQQIETVLRDNVKQVENNTEQRIINGNPLTGYQCNLNDYIGAFTSEICVIPEGNNKNELFGWAMPRLNDFSVNRSYFSWLNKNKFVALDARIKGGERHIIMSGEYDKYVPNTIYNEFLIKSIIYENIEEMEQLGIYEIAPEDYAVAEFIDSSKLELQRIVREGLDLLMKENA